MASPKGGTAVESGLISRLGAGLRYAFTGKGFEDFFGPGDPIAPVAQEAAHGRAWDFPVGYNLSTQPRSGEAVTFPVLRALADNFDLVRLAIETRKDQMGKLKWGVRRKDTGKEDATSAAIQLQLQEPDAEYDFGDWLRMLLEDLLVIDAPAVYIWPTKGGDVYALEQIDGATIKRVIDARGRTPKPPAEGEPFDEVKHTAYQQLIKGLPATSYHADELIYKPRNPRRHKVYGFSPVEQIILIINLGLRRQTHQLAFYTAGNVPDMLMAAPASWSMDQIEKFQKYWDVLMTGDAEKRRQMRMVPSDLKPLALRPESSLFDAFDEWIARVVCYCFSLPPTAFTKQVNRATAETAQEAALSEGLAPLMEWTTSFMNRLIRKAWKTDDYVFAWLDEDSMDPLVQAQVDEIYVKNKIRLVNEVRADHDWESKPELDEQQLAPPPAPFGGAPGGATSVDADTGGQANAKAGADAGAAAGAKAGAEVADKMAAVVFAAMGTLTKSAQSDAGLETMVSAIAELRAELATRAAAEAPQPTVPQLADALEKMVNAGVPLNKALASAGFDFTVPGGDVGLVSAARIPLAMAGDTEPLTAPEPVEKRAPEPAPPITITIPVTIEAAPAPLEKAVTKRFSFTRNTDGELTAAEVTDRPDDSPALPSEG